MKRFAIATVAALTLVGSLAAPALADPPGWDNHNNGYYTGNTFHYGTPSATVMRRHDYRPGFQSWRRGQRLPTSYRSRYQEVDWHQAHLQAPRRGYHYVRDDSGQILLVAVATGLIASIIANH